MSTYLPVYTLEVRVAPSVDATEATVLTPATGAWHSDPFKACTTHLAGYVPYLQVPRGRRGRINLLERTLDKGQLRFSLMDKRDGFDNLKRWVTAFVGNNAGLNQLNGCRVITRESLDGGATFTDFFTGRIRHVGQRGKLWIDLDVRDFGDDLEMEVFANRPHSSITYAFQGALSPIRLPQSYAWAENSEPPFRSTIQVDGSITYVDVGVDRRQLRGLCTLGVAKHFDGFQDFFLVSGSRGSGNISGDKLRLKLKRTDTSAEGEFQVRQVVVEKDAGTAQNWMIWRVAIEALPTTDANYLAMPPNTTPVEWRMVATQEKTSDNAPIFVSDVHPVQYLADLVDGKFGPLKVDGSVSRKVERGSTWAALIADQTFLKMRDIVPKAFKLNKYAEDHILKIAELAWTWNSSGALELVDLRTKSTLPADTPKVTDDDLLSTRRGEGWDQDADDAVTRVDAIFYKDRELPLDLSAHQGAGFVDIRPALVGSVDIPVIRLDFSPRALDLGEKIWKIDARTYRAWENDPDFGRMMMVVYLAALKQISHNIKTPFASGATRMTALFRRGSPGDRMPGDLLLYDISVFPNAQTNMRGGTRLARVVGREEDGNGVRVEFVDLSVETQATVPAALSLIAVMPDAVDIAVTLNASSEPVQIDLAVTPTNSLPAETSTLWRPAFGHDTVSSGTFRVGDLQEENFVFARARTVPRGDFNRKRPSAYITSSSISLVGTLNAPTGLSVTSIERTSAVVSWTLGAGSSGYHVELYLNEGTAPGTWTEEYRFAILPPGTSSFRIFGLAGPSVAHAFAIRHVALDSGAVSAFATTTITTGSGTAPKAPAPRGITKVEAF